MSLTTADKLEIIELAARYCHAVDHLDTEAYTAMFTEDCEVYADGRLRGQGHAFLAENIRKTSGLKRRHWTCNAIIDGDAQAARLRAYIMVIEYSKSLTPYLMGEYDDSLVKVNGQWKFKVHRAIICSGPKIV